MIKHFCDVCENELTDENCVPHDAGRLHRLRHDKSTLMFEITTGLKGTWNSGDFCKYCVIDAINKLDDRPRIYPG